MNITTLPYLKNETQVHYEGSIDKLGANADWDWWLYRDGRGEWVIFDVYGPGCIYNFVQHRYISSEEPVFRFYFDDDEAPRFVIRAGEFGIKYPFVEPLASRYIGPVDNGRGPIRVIRSFLPMLYKKSCRVTSSVKLEGFDRSLGHGGWGHIVYHSYTSDPGIETFTGEEAYGSLIRMLKNVGSDPKPTDHNIERILSGIEIAPGEARAVFERKGHGALNAVRMIVGKRERERLNDLWIRMRWDGHKTPDIFVPAGCFFGNELWENDARYLMMGSTRSGYLYNYFPMPYWREATVELVNRSDDAFPVTLFEVHYNDSACYEENACGYFRASPYYDRNHTEGADSIIADITGRGHAVAALVTCFAQKAGVVSCEGDVRVHIDGIRTPQIESDGSESYACYGWGFPTPPETNPFSGYDGLPDNPWSMMRTLLADWYPFHSRLRFGIESGGNNDQYLEHSGAVFYYGRDDADIICTDALDLENEDDIARHKYRAEGGKRVTLSSFFEGDDDHIAVDGAGYAEMEYSTFTARVNPANMGVRLRRRSDQNIGRQAARVFVNGVEVTERIWYFADRNCHKRWLEDEFDIPERYTTGKAGLDLKIVPFSLDGSERASWNEYGYEIFCFI